MIVLGGDARADIEVILGVDYNHTAEGNHKGPTLFSANKSLAWAAAVGPRCLPPRGGRVARPQSGVFGAWEHKRRAAQGRSG